MYNSLQICRALAALIVVCFHLGAYLPREKYLGAAANGVGKLFFFGDAGVHFFFVLSGFIVTWIHHRDFNHPKNFFTYIKKRASRIYPSYWIIFTMVYGATYITPALRATLPADASTLIKALLLLPQDKHLVGGTGAPVFFVAWTLQYEILFYAALALAIIRLWLFLLLVVVFLLNYFFHPFGTIGLYQEFFSSSRIFLFGMGVLVAYATRSRWRLNHPVAVLWLASLAFAALAMMEVISRDKSGWFDHIMAYGVFSSIILFSLVRYEDAGGNISGTNPLVKIGDASYVLYLIHAPLLTLLCRAAAKIGFSGEFGAWISAAMILLACALVARIFHVYIERPIMKIGRKSRLAVMDRDTQDGKGAQQGT